jgi:tRNA (guanine-N7-)-methyltransferase
VRVDPYADAPRLPAGERVDPRALVGAGDRPIELEIGPGRGWFLVERLESSPESRIVGLEIRRKWATVVDRRLAARGFGERARVFAEDARFALPRFPAACAKIVFVHFPDPWWKKRHQKRLLLTPELVEQIARVLAAGGELFVQTDVEERARAYQETIAANPCFEPISVADNPFGARSPRERRAIADRLPITRLLYRRAI